MGHLSRCGCLALLIALAGNRESASADQPRRLEPSVAAYSSIQAAIDANPGQMVYIPSGDYPISAKIRIRTDGSGLYGPGRIVQQNAQEPIIEIEQASGAEVRDVTLARPEGDQETFNEGVLAIKARNLVIENVRIIDNRTCSAAIALRDCTGSRLSRCLVQNYMRVTVDDRTADPNWGYAFNCTDGTGISVRSSRGTLIDANRIIEDNLRPTLEIKAKYKLGDWVKKNPVKGRLVQKQMWDAAFTDNWQQGSAIIVTSPEESDLTRILGNHIEHAAIVTPSQSKRDRMLLGDFTSPITSFLLAPRG